MNEQIEQAIKIITSDNPTIFGTEKYQSIYMFATENIHEVINSIDVKDKSILTVSSSGDHIFNMLLNGAKSIEAYDINYFTKYYFYLKESAIRTLNYNEFIDFFFGRKYSLKKDVFNEQKFKLVIENIKDKESKLFWDILLSGCGGKRLYKSNLFFRNHYSKNTYIECNDYLRKEENYKALQQLLNNYNYTFYLVNIFNDISNIPNKEYDIIYLSNILDRIIGKDKLETIKKIKDIIIKVKEYLSPNGVLGICYLYNYLDDYWAIEHSSQICNPNVRYKHFNEKDGYIYESFEGVCNYGSNSVKDRDAIMLVRKRNN